MRSKKVVRKIGMMLVVLCTLLASSIPAKASEESEILENARSAILQVSLVYQTPDGEVDVMQSGTGFLINSEYILTSYHITHLDKDSEIFEDRAEYYGSEFTEHIKDRVKIKVTLMNDVTVDAEEKSGSEAGDYDILQLQQTVNEKAALPLGNSDNVSVTQNVFALGFPATVSGSKRQTMYSAEDVNVSTGTVQKRTEIAGEEFLQHSASLSDGNSGGPLMDSEGNVIGINKGVIEDNKANNYFYSVPINRVKTLLNTLGIEYTGVDTVAETTEEVSTNAESTEEVVTEPLTLAQPATVNPDEEAGVNKGVNTGLVIGIVAGVVILIVIIILIIVFATKGKKKKGSAPAPTPMRPTQPNSGRPVQPQQTAPQFNMSEGSNETTVLNEGGGETTVLGGGQASATLFRIKNGEKIVINRPEFTIGKERRRVDYCISDNNSVSRCHSKIITRGNQHFIIDMNSTNFTYVNGVKIAPNQEKEVRNGDKIKISDEEFEFRTI